MRFVSAATFACSVMGIVMPLVTVSAEIPNGIYRVSADGSGVQTARSSGGTIHLAEQLSSNFGNSTIWSLSNQNDRFRVWMKEAGGAILNRFMPMSLQVAGFAEVAPGHSWLGRRYSTRWGCLEPAISRGDGGLSPGGIAFV